MREESDGRSEESRTKHQCDDCAALFKAKTPMLANFFAKIVFNEAIMNQYLFCVFFQRCCVELTAAEAARRSSPASVHLTLEPPFTLEGAGGSGRSSG
jgi:hypothetical protein